jgi:hypothetical protein
VAEITDMVDSSMGDLTSFLKDLLDYLCSIRALLDDPVSRGMLLSYIPHGLAATVPRHAAARQDLHTIISYAEQWGRMSNGVQALEAVLESARPFVKGLVLEQQLDTLIQRLRQLLETSHKLPPVVATATAKSYANACLAIMLIDLAARAGRIIPDDVRGQLADLPGLRIDWQSFEKDGADVIFHMWLENTGGSEKEVWTRVGRADDCDQASTLAKKLKQAIADRSGEYGRRSPRDPLPSVSQVGPTTLAIYDQSKGGVLGVGRVSRADSMQDTTDQDISGFLEDFLHFLRSIPALNDPLSRGMLLRKVPHDLALTLPRHSACMQDLYTIIGFAEQWRRMSSGVQALEAVLECSRLFVKDCALEQQLDALKRRFRRLLETSLQEHLQVAADPSRSQDERSAAVQHVADNIDAEIPLDFLRHLETAYYITEDPTLRYWLAIAPGYTGRPKAKEVLERLSSWEQHPYPKEGIQQALTELGVRL